MIKAIARLIPGRLTKSLHAARSVALFSNDKHQTPNMQNSSQKRIDESRKQGDLNSLNHSGLKMQNGVFIDEARIKAKMQEIKKRKQAGADTPKKQKAEFLKNYEILKADSPVRKFRVDTGTEQLLNLQDISLDTKPTILNVTSYSQKEIVVDNFTYPPSLILTPNQVFTWEVLQPGQITRDHLKFIELVKPTPTYVIIGCQEYEQISADVRNYLEGLGIDIDILPVFESFSNFNECVGNGAQLVAFINTTGLKSD